jgi:hypothetical protein
VIFAVISFALIALNYTMSSHNLSAVTRGGCIRTYHHLDPDHMPYLKECCTAELDENSHITSAKCTRQLCYRDGYYSKNCAFIEKGKQPHDETISPEDFNTLEENNTKVPNTDLLTDENLAESQNTTDGNDITKPPKDLGGLNDEDLPEPDQ